MSAAEQQSLDSSAYSEELEHHEGRVQSSGAERQELRAKTKGLADAMGEHEGHTVAGERQNAIETAEDFLATLMYVSTAQIIAPCHTLFLTLAPLPYPHAHTDDAQGR